MSQAMVHGRTRDHSCLLTADAFIEGDSSIPSWAIDAYREFEHEVQMVDPAFPCFYARRALNGGGIRFSSIYSPDEEAGRWLLANALAEYADTRDEYGELTAFVAFFAPDDEARTYERQRDRFWAMLQWLHDHDPSPWPVKVPTTPEHPLWEFCFYGVPLFILCSGPFHLLRRSRRTSSFGLVFQPREQFARLMEHENRLRTARTVIRRRIDSFDEISMHPDILMHNEPQNREWRQYIVPDENVSVPGPCPFHVRRGDEADGDTASTPTP